MRVFAGRGSQEGRALVGTMEEIPRTTGDSSRLSRWQISCGWKYVLNVFYLIQRFIQAPAVEEPVAQRSVSIDPLPPPAARNNPHPFGLRRVALSPVASSRRCE